LDFYARTASVDGTELVQLHGELDLATAAHIDDLRRVVRRPKVLVDASGLTFVDVRGMAALLAWHQALVDEGGEGLVVRNAPPLLRRVAELTGTTGVLGLDD